MHTHKLGELPESLRAWSKFRPAGNDDFADRAKILASILELPLQKTQDVYARACGFNDRYELQQVMKIAGDPGPYDDTIPLDILGDLANAKSLVQFYRHARLIRAICELVEEFPGRAFRNADTIACDLALFSRPSAHNAAVKAVKKFLEGQSGCSPDGYPYGFRGVVHHRYFDSPPIDNATLAALEAAWGPRRNNDERYFDPREQNRAVLRYRAPILFMGMADTTAADFLRHPPDLKLDAEIAMLDTPTEADMWLLTDIDRSIAHLLCNKVNKNAGEDEFQHLLAALRSPLPDLIAISTVASSIVDFAAQVPKWRLSFRYQSAASFRDGGPEWEHTSEPHTLVFDSFGEENGQWRWMSVCLRDMNTELNQMHWQVDATLFLCESSNEPWKAAAVLTGDLMVANKDRVCDHPEVVARYHESDARLYRAWKRLSSHYLPIAGYVTYDEWVNDALEGLGGVFTILDPWVAPAHRGSKVSRWLMEAFVEAFGEGGIAEAFDMYWFNRLDPRTEEPNIDVDPGDDLVEGPGVIFIPLPGSRTFGYSVWNGNGNERSAKMLHLNGEHVSRRPRWDELEPIKGGLAPHLLDVVKSIKADVVLYDPEDAASDEDTSE